MEKTAKTRAPLCITMSTAKVTELNGKYNYEYRQRWSGCGEKIINRIKEWFQNTCLLEELKNIKEHKGQRSLQSFWEESQMHFLNMN
jgi:hypothetical protein